MLRDLAVLAAMASRVHHGDAGQPVVGGPRRTSSRWLFLKVELWKLKPTLSR
jgi:hypothetical protein